MTKKHQKPVHAHHESEATESDDTRIQEGLNAIYGKERVDFTKLDKAHTRLTSILLTVVITLFVIAITAWAGFFVYTKYVAPEEEERFTLSIEAPETLVSGEETTIEIHYKNPTAVPIASLTIDARLPSTFVITSAQPLPSNEEELLWEIGTIAPGSDGTIAVQGIWIAQAPSQTPIQVFADFRPGNFNADFQEIETRYIQTLASTLTATLEGPQESVSGDLASYELKVKNTGTTAFQNVRAELALPDGFFIADSHPPVEPGLGTNWVIDVLDVDQEVTIAFSGSFAADVEGFQYFDVTVGIAPESQLLSQATAQAFTDVLGTSFSLQLVANGATEDIAANLGEQLRLTVAYEYTGEEALDDVELLLDFASELPMPIVWSEANLDGGTLTSRGIVWGPELLAPLLPNEKKILNLSFPVEDVVGSGQTDTFSIAVHATVAGRSIQSSPIQVTMNTEADFSAYIRYYTEEGAPLGNGPLPPTAGETTTYRIFWQIDNQLHALEDVTVSAVLPPHVQFADQAHADLGSISHDPSSGSVTWRITSLPTTIDTVTADFAIAVTPDENDIGTFLKLVSGSTLSATDSVTDVSIQKTTDSLTSDLTEDDFAADKGAVIP